MQNNAPPLDFEQALEQNKDKIYRICRVYAVSPVEPQDLFQEVVYQIWKSFSSFKQASSIDTWIYRIAINVCYRAKSRLNKTQEKTTRLDSIQFALADAMPDDDQEEKYQALRACIAGLNEGDKSIIVLYLEDLPYKKIAEVTGLTANYVAVKMKRIRKTLFDCISKTIKIT